MTTEEKEDDVDIGCTTPVIHDDFWEKADPNSPMIYLIPQTIASPSATKILSSCEERSSRVKSAPDQESAASANENENENENYSFFTNCHFQPNAHFAKV